MENKMKNNYVPSRILSKQEKEEISEGTIERFNEYINKYVKETMESEEMKETENKEVIDMEDVNKNPFDDIGGDYVKLEKDKAKVLLLVNWKIEDVEKFTDETTGKLKKQKEFTADVLREDGVACTKTFSTVSFKALQGLKDVFSKYWPETNRAVLIRIKKIGEGKSTVYDVEEQAIMK